MQRVGVRAYEVVKKVEHYLCDQYSAALLKDEIELALKEQDKLTRHAIADALLNGSSPVKLPNEGLKDIIEANRAENIAMNTSAL